jgi:hypothetical protein
METERRTKFFSGIITSNAKLRVIPQYKTGHRLKVIKVRPLDYSVPTPTNSSAKSTFVASQPIG